MRRVLYRLPTVLAAARAGSRVYVVEGERDADALNAQGLCATTCSGGAGRWRPEYAEALRGAAVVIVADKDTPGRAHGQDAARLCSGTAASVRLLEVPGDQAKDAADFLSAGGTGDELERLADAAPEWVATAVATPADERPLTAAEGPARRSADEQRFALALVEETWTKWMTATDLYPLHCTLGAHAANHLEGDPVWLVIVGGSGSGKTEAVCALRKVAGVRLAATLTGPAALLSGSPKREKTKESTGGLLRQIGERGVLVLKDFTTILSMHREQRAEVIAALREIYDGSWTRDVGADGGRSLTWEGRLGLIAASTGAIDNAHQVMSAMGARFLFAREPVVDGKLQGARARRHAGHERQMREEIAEAVRDLLGRLPEDAPAFPEDHHERIVSLAVLAALARSPVERDYRGEVELVLEAEAPTRIVKQLSQLLRGLLWIGLDTEDAWSVVVRAGFDSIPQLRRRIVDALAASDAGLSTAEIAGLVDHPTRTTLRSLEDLDAHGVVVREGEGVGTAYRWSLSAYALELLEDIGTRRSGASGSVPEMSEASL